MDVGEIIYRIWSGVCRGKIGILVVCSLRVGPLVL